MGYYDGIIFKRILAVSKQQLCESLVISDWKASFIHVSPPLPVKREVWPYPCVSKSK